MTLSREDILRVVVPALEEDLGRDGDVTSAAVIAEEATASAVVLSRSDGVVAGLPVAKEVFGRVGARIRPAVSDGDRIEPGRRVAEVGGPLRAILAAERTALNFLGRLSGVATEAARYVAAVEGTGVRVRDTRKTTPGLRVVEKEAARIGGCEIYRTGLFQGLFLKDNHVAAAGGVAEAVRRARRARPDLRVLVEVETPEQAEEAVAAGAEEVLLDNMGLEELKETVARVGGRARLEASGGITLENVRAVAETGVDAVSVGAITHAAPWLDFSLEVGGEGG
jgi:nicotinate-nucleotide pyrophosphorylase (carboxylating)